VLSVESQPTFRRSVEAPSLPGRRLSQARNDTCYMLHAGFLLGSLLDAERGSNMFLRNVCRLSTDYTALYPNRQNSSETSFGGFLRISVLGCYAVDQYANDYVSSQTKAIQTTISNPLCLSIRSNSIQLFVILIII
jgi:hypothetical protein